MVIEPQWHKILGLASSLPSCGHSNSGCRDNYTVIMLKPILVIFIMQLSEVEILIHTEVRASGAHELYFQQWQQNHLPTKGIITLYPNMLFSRS